MKFLASIAGGFAGACAVTLLNEVIRRYDKTAPRVDLLGKEVAREAHHALGTEVPSEDTLYKESLAGDLLSNTLYFSIAGFNDKHTEIQGGAQGIMAGLGAVYAPGIINALKVEHTGGTDKKEILTTAYYFVGGVVAAKVMKWVEEMLQDRSDRQQWIAGGTNH